jgi:hypothetical protein
MPVPCHRRTSSPYCPSMRFEYLCDIRLAYDEHMVVWVTPGGGEERQGFGMGAGEVVGGLTGAVRWSNFPRLRGDGVPMPDVRGVIETAEGPVMFELRGYAERLQSAGNRQVTASVHFKANADGPHAWLNHIVAIHEGHITPDGTTNFPTYVCRPS